MESTETELPDDAIVIDFSFEMDDVAAKRVMKKLSMFISDEEYEILMKYMTCEIGYGLITDEDSPVLEAMRHTMKSFRQIVQGDLVMLQGVVEVQNELIAEQNNEILELKNQLSALTSRLSSLTSTLSRARKMLKTDGVKDALGFCDKLRTQNSVGEMGRTALLLADTIKDTLITTKGA